MEIPLLLALAVVLVLFYWVWIASPRSIQAGREQLLRAQSQASGATFFPVDPRRVLFWEAMSNLKWAISCVRRGLARGADGRPASSELAAIGRRLEEPLWDFMALASAKA